LVFAAKGAGRKIFREINEKKRSKIALLRLFQARDQQKKTEK